MQFKVKIQPRASKNEIIGMRDGMLWLRLTAPPIENKANFALIDFLANQLSLRKSEVRLVSGAKSRIKLIEIDGITESDFSNKVKGK